MFATNSENSSLLFVVMYFLAEQNNTLLYTPNRQVNADLFFKSLLLQCIWLAWNIVSFHPSALPFSCSVPRWRRRCSNCRKTNQQIAVKKCHAMYYSQRVLVLCNWSMPFIKITEIITTMLLCSRSKLTYIKPSTSEPIIYAICFNLKTILTNVKCS